MGKHGPCYHCGVTSTPLWRNGPPEKPILCNACGSRWRTKGTLTNYTPLHSRPETDDFEDQRVSRVKIITINKNKEGKFLKRKQNHDNAFVGSSVSAYNSGYKKIIDEDISTRSSCGSAISYSESCARFDNADASEFTGPAQPVVWDTTVPSKKRTNVSRSKPSSVEKLTKDLYTIYYEQQSSLLSGSSQEEDVLIETEAPMGSLEIINGTVLISNPSYITRDEDSEASSLSVGNKFHRVNEQNAHSPILFVHNESKMVNRNTRASGQQMQETQMTREQSELEKFQILSSSNSPLCNIDLKDVLNFEELTKHLTNEEQDELMKYLPPVDTIEFPYSLKNMFGGDQFKENLSSFQHLLAEGVFDLSLGGVKPEDCKTLKRLAVFNSTKSHWVESYTMFKKCKNSTPDVVKASKSVNIKRLRDAKARNDPATKITMKSTKGVHNMTAKYENRESAYNDNSCFSPRSLFTLPLDNSSLMLDSFIFVDDEGSDQDLLLDVPSHNSFPQAELLHQPSKFRT